MKGSTTESPQENSLFLALFCVCAANIKYKNMWFKLTPFTKNGTNLTQQEFIISHI